MALGAEHGGSTAGRRQRALWIPQMCSARSPGAPRGPCFPAVVPLTWGDPRWPPPRAQSLRESRVRGGGAGGAATAGASEPPPRQLSQAMETHVGWRCSQNTMDGNGRDGSGSTCEFTTKRQEKHTFPNN